MSETNWIAIVENNINSPTLSEAEKAYFKRILRILKYPDLSRKPGHPIELVISKIINSDFYRRYNHIQIPEIVAEWETFDLFNFPKVHVARRPSDSYFIQKSIDTKKSILLRPHTSVMWYHYLIKGGGIKKLNENGEVKALSWGKVYRVDELDKTHHECFHQIDGLKITKKSKEIINQDTLKNVLTNTIKAIFNEDIKFRFNEDNFPYTTDSLEVEVDFGGKWLEVLGAGVVHPTVLEKLGINPSIYNGRAFGFGIERLVMAVKNIQDIRILWSDDKRITNQWGNLDIYKEVSNFPPVYKDISFLAGKNKFIQDKEESKKKGSIELTKDTESDLFEISGIIRDISGDAGNLIEEVKLIDIFEDDSKFGIDKKSVCIRIAFRSLSRTLTNKEINKVYLFIRKQLEDSLNYILR